MLWKVSETSRALYFSVNRPVKGTILLLVAMQGENTNIERNRETERQRDRETERQKYRERARERDKEFKNLFYFVFLGH